MTYKMLNPNKVLGNILGTKPKKDFKSKNSDRNVAIGGEVSQEEYDTVKEWFNKRFLDDSFEEFTKKTKLRVKK